jgi:hypothetical protein
VLAGAAGASLLLLLVVRSPLVLMLHLLADVALGGYVYLLIKFTNHRPVRATAYAAGIPTRSARVVPIRHPEPPRRPELAPVPEFALSRTASR